MFKDQEFKKFYSDIDQKNFKNFYFLYGDEDFLIQRAYQYLLGQLLEPTQMDFNFHAYYPDEVKTENIYDIYEMYPMMAARRVIVFKEIQSMSESVLSEVLDIFTRPNELTVVIFLAQSIDKRKKNIKIIMDKTLSIEFKKPFENQIPFWIKFLAQEQELKMESDAIHLLHHKVGNSLRSLNQEILKIKEFSDSMDIITESLIKNLIGVTAEENSFALVDRWMEKEPIDQFKVIEELIENGENELGFIQLLARQTRLLMQVKSGLDNNESKDTISKKIHVPLYFLDKYIRQSRHWETIELRKNLAYLSEMELNLKKHPHLKKSILSSGISFI